MKPRRKADRPDSGDSASDRPQPPRGDRPQALGENTIKIDCDVLQADGGTRLRSITGAYVALADAVNWMISKGLIEKSPLKDSVSAISVGMSEGQPVLDLDYVEDSSSDTDMNVVMTGSGVLWKSRARLKATSLTRDDLNRLLDLSGKRQ